MVSKPKKPVAKKETVPPTAAAVAATDTPPTTAAAAAADTPAASTTETASKTPDDNTPATAATTTTTTTTPAPTSTATPGAPTFPEEVVTNLTTMGFPEAEVRHCLRVAHGNPDVAVEFLTNGIPEGMGDAASLVQAASSTPNAAAVAATTTTGGGGGGPLQSLRNHSQFNALKRLVQTNPAALQQVLAQIGQQQPDLLAEINANQAAFLEMMNEPITEATPVSSSSGAAGGPYNLANMRSPQQMAQLIASMGEAELAQMAQMIGMTPEQLRATAQHASANGGAGFGGGGGGETVLRLTPDEMAAVDRLTEMGFDRAEAAQAFLACDKNEALAANLLMDSMGGGGMFGGGGGGGGNDGGGGGDGNNNNNADDDDNMYD